MQKDDRSAKLRLRLHSFQLIEDELGYFSRSLANALVPIIGVKLVADNSEAILLNADDRSGLIVGVWFFVNVVGWSEVERLNSKLAGEEAFGELDFEVKLLRRDFADVGMKEGVIADFVAFARNPLHEADVLLRFGSDHHERPLDLFLLENVEDFGSPFGIRTVVEAECDLVRVVAVLQNGVSMRIRIHMLIDDEFFAWVGLVGVDHDCAPASLRQAGDADNFAVALCFDIVSRLHGI